MPTQITFDRLNEDRIPFALRRRSMNEKYKLLLIRVAVVLSVHSLTKLILIHSQTKPYARTISRMPCHAIYLYLS